jgi:hypothetical protein
MLRAALALLAAASVHADTTVAFQNGVNGYSGAKDISINTKYAESNGGNGVRWSGDPELGCDTITGSGAYAVRYLLKFGGLTVPAGSRVVSASLAISLDYWNATGGNLTGFYLKNAWDPSSSRLGWLHRDATHDWAGAGASAAGVDTAADFSFRVPPLRAVGPQTVTIALDAAQVQGWIDSPAANQGIMLVAGPLGYVVPAAQTRHVITDLTPSTGYTISVSVIGGNHTVSITPGASSMSTAAAVLTFQVSAGGQVTP